MTTPALTPDEFITLERLSRKAAHESLRAHRAHLDEDDRFDDLAIHLLETGIRAWHRYDPTGYPDVARETYAYRAMRGHRAGTFTDGPYLDWMRRTVRDNRFEPDIVTSLTTDGELPETHAVETETVRAVAWSIARTLDPYNAQTLLELVVPMVEDGIGIADAADHAGFTIGEARDRLDSLAHQLPDLRPVRRLTPAPALTTIFTDALRLTFDREAA